jgi:hypothetical protein
MVQDSNEAGKTPDTTVTARKTPDTAVQSIVLRTQMETTTHMHTASVQTTVSTPLSQMEENKTSSVDTDEESDYRKMSHGRIGYPTHSTVGTHKPEDFGTPTSSSQSGADSPSLTPRSSPRMERNAEEQDVNSMQSTRTPEVIELLSPDSMPPTPQQQGADQDDGLSRWSPVAVLASGRVFKPSSIGRHPRLSHTTAILR